MADGPQPGRFVPVDSNRILTDRRSTKTTVWNASRSSRWRLFALLVVTLAVRGGILIAQGRSLDRDPDLYRSIAQTLRSERFFGRRDLQEVPRPTAFRPPLYPLVLAASAWDDRIPAASVALLHLTTGVLTVLATRWLAQKFQLGSGADVAALAVAVDPLLLIQSTQVMTETMATLLTVVALLAITTWQRKSEASRSPYKSCLVAGFSVGLAALCRPTFLPWSVFVISIICASNNRRNFWRSGRISESLVFVLALVLTLAPWALRNRAVMGQAIVTTTHGGYTLLLGNNRSFYESLSQDGDGEPWTADPAHQIVDRLLAEKQWNLVADETKIDAALAEFAWGEIRRQPRRFIQACLYRWMQLWTPLAHAEPHESKVRTWLRYLSALWYSLVFIAAMAAIIGNRRTLFRTPLVHGLTLCLTFTAVHTLYWSNIRMRAPLMPVVYMTALLPGAKRTIGTARAQP